MSNTDNSDHQAPGTEAVSATPQHVPAFLLKRPVEEDRAREQAELPNLPDGDLFAFDHEQGGELLSEDDAAVLPHVLDTRLAPTSSTVTQDMAGNQAQFRLRRLQAFNWGTFQGIADFPIAPEGYLFVGNSGSGKSTMLDGLAALTTPAATRTFNAAAREADRGRSDRNLVTYVRGAWARQSNDEREAVQQFLRKNTTWSALAATYRNANGIVVSIVMLMWIRGTSTSMRDLRQQYFVFEREFDVTEFKAPFADTDFDLRKLKAAFPGVFVRDEFKAYQERFCRLLGIENDRALRLLHKTQSTKDLGELNVFLRDFMLDEPETLAVAERLVKDFQELNDAHAEVVSARKQIQSLTPARDNFIARARHVTQIDELQAVDEHLESFAQEQRRDLLSVEIDVTRREIQRVQIDIDSGKKKEANEKDIRDQYITQVQGAGGLLLQNLDQRIQEAENQKESRLAKHSLVDGACRFLEWSTPNTALDFLTTVEKARTMLHGSTSVDELEQRRDPVKREQERKSARLSDLRNEIASMERQPSNIPAPFLRLRADLADELGVQPSELPFAGELMEVQVDHAEWTGAIERVLHGFSLSIVVQPDMYADFSRVLNERHTGMRVVYLRAMVASPNEVDKRTLDAGSLVRKIKLADGPHQNWVRQQLRQQFDYACVEDMAEFRSSTRAVTKNGQVKHSSTRHEKDDRFDVRDRRRWVMGLDNVAKRAVYIEEAQTVGTDLAALQLKLTALNSERTEQLQRRDKANVLVNVNWEEIDVSGLLGQIGALQRQRQLELERNPDLDRLRDLLANQEKHYNAAVHERQNAEAQEREKLNRITSLQRKLDSLVVSRALSDAMRAEIKERFAQVARPLTLDSLDGIVSTVFRSVANERDRHKTRAGELKAAIEQVFHDYSRIWQSEAGGLDPKLESATDFIAILERLESDDLPRFEGRFMQLLQQQSNQNLATLQQRLDFERKQIHDRLDQVNSSLKTADYNPGTHLVIEPHDRTLDEVKAFRTQLREALTQAFTQDKDAAERRFEVLSAMVKRLSSQDPANVKWRTVVLDVRLHVDFRVRELGHDGIEREVYHSGAGKSGGQRQKLAAACLAAALRYQLGGQDRVAPSYSTVVLDEAFDKADAEFTAAAMTIFKTFGFQMVVATPMRSVMTLEPFIGGASVIRIVDGKSSRFSQVQYDTARGRLGLTSEMHSPPNDI